jgi:rod shape-determining protein MreD
MKKFLLYSGLILLLVPVQTTLLPHVAIWGIKPDLGLVVAAVVGLLAGELEGLLLGLAIGWILNLYSAGDLWLSLLTTGGAGLFAGLVGRQVAQVTPMILAIGLLLLSLAGGLVAVLGMKNGTMSDSWWMVQSVVVPQACFDAVLGGGLLWFLGQRFMLQRLGTFDRYS